MDCSAHQHFHARKLYSVQVGLFQNGSLGWHLGVPCDEIVELGINCILCLLGRRELAATTLVHNLNSKAKSCRDGNGWSSSDCHILQVLGWNLCTAIQHRAYMVL